MVGVSHLDDAEFSLDLVRIAVHDKVHHRVRKVVFNAVFAELLVVFTGHFTDEEGGQTEATNRFKEAENFVPRVLHFCEREKGTKGVEDQNLESNRVAVAGELSDQLAHPIDAIAHALFVELHTQVGEVNDGNAVAHARVFHVHAHVGHVRAQGFLPLLQGHVDA